MTAARLAQKSRSLHLGGSRSLSSVALRSRGASLRPVSSPLRSALSR